MAMASAVREQSLLGQKRDDSRPEHFLDRLEAALGTEPMKNKKCPIIGQAGARSVQRLDTARTRRARPSKGEAHICWRDELCESFRR